MNSNIHLSRGNGGPIKTLRDIFCACRDVFSGANASQGLRIWDKPQCFFVPPVTWPLEPNITGLCLRLARRFLPCANASQGLFWSRERNTTYPVSRSCHDSRSGTSRDICCGRRDVFAGRNRFRCLVGNRGSPTGFTRAKSHSGNIDRGKR